MLLDAYQMNVYKKFPQTSWLSNKSIYERIIDWVTFYRRNIPVFVEHYFGIPLHLYQIIWLYILNICISTVIIAGRASAKSYIIAVFACAKCVLYPNTKCIIVSGTKKQAALIIKEKIEKELIPKSETLRREIKKIKNNSNDIEAEFHNGSSIIVVVNSEDALGYRGTLLVFEEFKRIKKYIIDKVIKPFAMTRPAQFRTNTECESYGVRYNDNEEFNEEPASVYISSAAPTSHWMDKLLKDTVKSKYTNGTSCMLATDYSIALKHNIKTRMNLIETKRTTDPITWREEYENERLRESASAYFTYGLLTQNQTYKKAFYPQKNDDVRNRRKNPYYIPKQSGEIRVLACDIAFIERSNKNDNSCSTLIRAFPESVKYESVGVDGKTVEVKNGYRRIVPYIEANPGSDVDKQAIRIKQLFYDFEADYIVLDARNGGVLVYDRLAKVLYDEERDCEYPAWKCINDEVIANRVTVGGAAENLFIVNATAKINNDAAVSLRSVLKSKMIELLISIEESRDFLNDNYMEYSETPNGDVMAFYERPYAETQALIGEMISLEHTRNDQTGFVKLFETGSNTKDRYTSLAYGNYFIELLEQDLLSDSSEYDYVPLFN